MGNNDKSKDFKLVPNSDSLQIQTSRPAVIQRHDISDEELDMLCDSKSDMVREFLWVAIGVALGSLSSAIAGMMTYSNSTINIKMPLDDLIQIVLFWGGLLVSIVLGIVAFNRNKRAKSLQGEIRDRSSGKKQ